VENSVVATEIRHNGFFVLRSPYFPLEIAAEWSAGLTASGGNTSIGVEGRSEWQRDITWLRDKLEQILARDDFTQALFIASPSLEDAIRYWRKDPDSRKGLNAERAIVRYLQRMCQRPTPFGLFAGCSVGTIGSGSVTSLCLSRQEDYRTSTRLDFDYLCSIASYLISDRTLRRYLRYGANTSLHRVGEHWHYIHSRRVGSRASHALIKVEADAYLDRVIQTVRSGDSLWCDLTQSIFSCAEEDDLHPEEVEAYLHSLVDDEIVVPTLVPAVTGGSCLDELLSCIASLPNIDVVSQTLRYCRGEMAEWDARSPQMTPDVYRKLLSRLRTLPVTVEPGKTLQIDLIKPGKGLHLDERVAQAIADSVRILCRLDGSRENPEMQRFRDAFAARFDQAWVPLVEALDEEMGVGFGSESTSDGSPLLASLHLGRPDLTHESHDLSRFYSLLSRRMMGSASDGRDEIVLSEEDLPRRDNPERVLPRSFGVFATIVASSSENVAKGHFQIFVGGGTGPSGARLMGRFCHSLPELEPWIRKLVKEEEALDSDAVFAEVVHLPEGRLGNVICRPVLRDYEIPYLARSGAPADRQIPIGDLLITVRRGSIYLYSRRLQRRVIPRLSSAHGFMNRKLAPVYRFLCHLQQQGGVMVPSFQFGSMSSLSYLPRVRVGQTILSCAQWRLSKEEIAPLTNLDRYEMFTHIQHIRRIRDLPRWVEMSEGDNLLPVDLDNPLSVDAFAHVAKRNSGATLYEQFPGSSGVCVTGPEGHYTHEVLVPFIVQATSNPKDSAPISIYSELSTATALNVGRDLATRRILPGGDWQYLKVYAGIACQDDILTSIVPQLLAELDIDEERGEWFFLRYADPAPHLRVRFRSSLLRVSSSTKRLLQPLITSGRVWKVQFDTYEREIERYGGQEATMIAEEIFTADSNAVLSILRSLDGDEGLAWRWKLTLIGMDKLLADCGLDIGDRFAVAARIKDEMRAEFRVGGAKGGAIGAEFRKERKALQDLWTKGEQHPIVANALTAFAKRSRRVAVAVTHLRELESREVIGKHMTDLAISYVHMHVNRMIRSNQRAHEYVLYDFLHKLNLARSNQAVAPTTSSK
jgi:thiopeptide-type bacteriocin biosynthesis protein